MARDPYEWRAPTTEGWGFEEPHLTSPRAQEVHEHRRSHDYERPPWYDPRTDEEVCLGY